MFDFECYSEAGYMLGPDGKWRGLLKNKSGIAAVGAAAYSEHPSTRVLSLSYDIGDGLRIWIPEAGPGPRDLFDFIAAGGVLEAHNSMFEHLIWLNICEARMGWPPLPLEQLRCSASKGRAHGLPGKLEELAKVLNAPQQKDARGKTLINKCCIPNNQKRKPTAQDYGELYAYNAQDVRAEQAVSALCPALSPTELDVWMLDQRINARGVYIDRVMLDNCLSIVNQATEKYTKELLDVTNGEVDSAGKLAKILAWLRARGCYMDSLDAENVEAMIPQTDGSVRRVLEIRAMIGSASVKKLYAIDRMLCNDSRLRDLFVYCGAGHTGRWAGFGPQPQNLPRSGPPVVKCPACGAVYWKKLHICPECRGLRGPGCGADWDAALARKHISTRDLGLVEKMWGDAVAAVAGCLRSLFSAAPGHELLCSDYSAIEAVVLAMLAGEEWRIEVFRTHRKIYEASASMITGVPFEDFIAYKKEHKQHHPLRNKIGKYAELASGFQGALGAWKKFGAGRFLSDDEILVNVKAWRKASPSIVKLWYRVEDAARMAIETPGRIYSYQGIDYQVRGDVLYGRLLSGRELKYHHPSVVGGKIWFWGWNSDYTKGPKGWLQMATYGGHLTENCVQAHARDLLAHGLLEVDKAGYPIVLHVHDEIVAEVPEGWGSIAEVEQLMGTLPIWAADWPIKAAGGWRGKYYKK